MPSVSSLPSQAAAPAHVSRDGSAPTAALAPVASSGTVSLLEQNLQDPLNGPHRDGRIRNPVPSKLKGKTDGSKGNFGVMQIEVAGRTEATERDAEAKRTSESTELAAKRAFENGYVSLRRSRFVHLPDEPVAKPFFPAQTTPPAPARVQRRTPLGPEEIKSEQARLLTLLRSLNPVLVVDQICKALAFFGGIPGAPPPEAGGFPESAEANGPGSLFVGWIAEIFPKLGGNYSQPTLDSTAQFDNQQPVKRKRGRPKGSKATKARKDKGVKKGSKPSTSSGQPQTSRVANENWVNVNDSGAEGATAVDTNMGLLARAANPQPQPCDSRLDARPTTPIQASDGPRIPLSPGQKRRNTEDGDTAAPGFSVTESSNFDLTPSVNGHETSLLSNNEGPRLPSAVPEPPPKRQRRGKDARPLSAKVNEMTAHVSSRVTSSSQSDPRFSKSVTDSSSEQASREAIAGNSETASVPASRGDHATATMQAVRQGQFALQSPMMDNLEAHLQAQFGQQVDIEQRSPMSHGSTDQGQAVTTLSSQPSHRNPAQQPQHQPGDWGNHNRSLGSQPQAVNGQAQGTPSASHQQARAVQGQHNQYNAPNSQLQQPQQQHQYRQPQQQSYVSAQTDQTHQHPQQQQQQLQQPAQLLGRQQHAQNRQFSANTSHPQQQQQQQQQQYTPSQQPFTSSQSQYPSGPQSITSQPRYRPHMATTTSTGTASYATHPSPQFTASLSNNFGPTNGSYRSSTTNLTNPSYDQRGQTGTTTPFRSAHGLPQQSSQFGVVSAGMQHRSASTGQSVSQSVQDLTTTQGFAGNAASDWGLFDASHLDTAGQQGTMGLNNPSYGISTTSAGASSNSGSTFATTSLSTFDTSGSGSNERYYGVGRR
ncbi:hypothetical protein VTH82DRAFT_2808 [Thermothelomyces myriococcoides]